MKKLVLFITILLGVNTGSYSAIEDFMDFDKVNKTITKELSLFYGGYKKIYFNGIDRQNIDFILGDISSDHAKKIEYDFKTILNEDIINISLDEKIEFKNISEIKKLKVIGKTYKNSSVNFKKVGENLEITLSSIGEYKITFTDKNQETKNIIFKKYNSRNFINNNIFSFLLQAVKSK